MSQGRYETGCITCISDILRRDGDKFILTEIKSSSSAKKEHELDLAFQKVVLEGAGYPINRCEVAHVNSSYVRKGDISPRELIRFTDITQEVEDLIEGTKRRIEKRRQMQPKCLIQPLKLRIIRRVVELERSYPLLYLVIVYTCQVWMQRNL